jgi:hypothetical protein
VFPNISLRLRLWLDDPDGLFQIAMVQVLPPTVPIVLCKPPFSTDVPFFRCIYRETPRSSGFQSQPEVEGKGGGTKAAPPRWGLGIPLPLVARISADLSKKGTSELS